MREADDVEFVAVHSAPGTVIVPDGFTVADFRGLRVVEVMTGAGSEQFVAFRFSSEAPYAAARVRLCEQLGVDPTAGGVVGGTVSQTKRAQESRRKRVSAAIIGIAAVLGPLEVVRNHYQFLLGSPSLSVSASHRQLDALEGELIEVHFTGLNTTPYSDNHVSLVAGEAWLESPQGERLSAATPDSASRVSESLAMGERHEMSVAVLPDLAGGTEQVVALEVRGRSGWLIPSRVETARTTVAVWPHAPVAGEDLELVEVGQGFAVLEGTVRCGVTRPNGIVCRAILRDARHAYPAQVYPESHETLERSESDPRLPGKPTASLRWRTRPLDAFESSRYRLVVAARAGSEVDWNAVLDELEIEVHDDGGR